MNEITNIHLGRQAFTIAVDAHRALRHYLNAIGEQTGHDKEVVEEVELRVAELLRERGVTGDKVVIMADIDYVKEQLGEPADFNDSEETGHHNRKSGSGAAPKDGTAPKRLYRDTDRAVVSGVSAGLAAYIGIDPIIIRLIFVLLTISGGAGILVYILLWVLVPAAESESDRLQMKGKPVTVENLKQAIEQADVPGAANRLANLFEKVFLVAGKLLLAIAGVGFIAAGIALMLGASAISSYALGHGFRLGNNGPVIFPLGATEVVAVVSTLAVVLVLAILSVLAGRAMIRRKWSVSGWVMAALVAVFVAGGGIGAAAITNSVEPVRTRYEQGQHVDRRSFPVFKSVQINAGDVLTHIEHSEEYAVEVRSTGDTPTSQVKTHFKDGVVTIDASRVRPSYDCNVLCPLGPTNIQITVYAPERVSINQVRGNSTNYYDKDGNLLYAEPSQP